MFESCQVPQGTTRAQRCQGIPVDRQRRNQTRKPSHSNTVSNEGNVQSSDRTQVGTTHARTVRTCSLMVSTVRVSYIPYSRRHLSAASSLLVQLVAFHLVARRNLGKGDGVLSYSFIYTKIPTSGNIRMSEPNLNPQRRQRTARGITEGLTR